MLFSLKKRVHSCLLKLLKSENDQLRAGETHSLFLNFLVSRVLLSCLKGIFLNFKFLQTSVFSFFRPTSTSRGRGSCKLVFHDKPISYGTLRETFRLDLKSIGADPSKFGLHSLHLGGATMATNSNVSDRVVQRHGRWRTVQNRNLYVDDNLDPRPAVSKFRGI